MKELEALQEIERQRKEKMLRQVKLNLAIKSKLYGFMKEKFKAKAIEAEKEEDQQQPDESPAFQPEIDFMDDGQFEVVTNRRGSRFRGGGGISVTT